MKRASAHRLRGRPLSFVGHASARYEKTTTFPRTASSSGGPSRHANTGINRATMPPPARSPTDVGTAANSETTRRVEAHDRRRIDYHTRIDAVRMLRSAGFPMADPLTGRVVERLAQARFFRLRGVPVGTVAFQSYPALVGERPTRALRTGDIDLAQDDGISVAIGESMSPVQEELQAVDASFRPVPNLSRPDRTSAFVNASGFRVEFLVSHRGSDDLTGALVPMPALGGVSAQPLRYLDFLIKDPVRSTLLHGGGNSVMVPAPERFAVHKLIVANERPEREKQGKDLTQSGFLIEALAGTSPSPWRHLGSRRGTECRPGAGTSRRDWHGSMRPRASPSRKSSARMAGCWATSRRGSDFHNPIHDTPTIRRPSAAPPPPPDPPAC
ncbi:hypothetical protein AIGOOFII_2156 [Methylobacterium marchantiae]|nr:hypothetical protein AIGOOFII_2156 [Methylobacterium marchantiae]